MLLREILSRSNPTSCKCRIRSRVNKIALVCAEITLTFSFWQRSRIKLSISNRPFRHTEQCGFQNRSNI